MAVFPPQNVNVLEQEKVDQLMLDMDGTDNKCKPQKHQSYTIRNAMILIIYLLLVK